MRKMPIQQFFTALVALSATLFAAGAKAAPDSSRIAYTFFDAGAARCEIVLPARPQSEEAEAAKLIQGTFKEMSGVETPIVSKPSGAPVIAIHVGATPYTNAAVAAIMPADLDDDGFVIHPVDGSNLVLLGRRGASTFYAATELLERYAGVLWAWPGEHGTVAPKTGTLSVSVESQIESPAFKAREFSGMGNAQMRLWRIHSGRNDIRMKFHHNTVRTLNPELFKEHPEYFGMTNGKRHVAPKRWQACTSNPDVVRIFTEAALTQFQRQPYIISFSVSPSDGGLDEFCQCDNCRALDVPGVEGISDRYYTFVNAVADGVREAHPDKLIACMAYGLPTRNIPARVTLRPNVLIYAVVPTLSDPHREIEAWSKAAPYLGAYFHLHGKPVPKIYPTRFASYLNFIREHRVIGVYAEVYPENEKRLSAWPQEAARVWLLSKLLWNPDADINALMDTFCTRVYGPAAEPMRRFYRICEAAHERRENPYDFGRHHRDFELDLYTAEDATRMEQALSEAVALAQGDAGALARITTQQRAWMRVSPYYQFADLPQRLPEMPLKSKADARAIVDVLARRVQVAAERVPEAPFALMPDGVEAAIDARFAEITTLMGADAKSFWRGLQRERPLLDRFIQPQLLALGGEMKNLARNPGFETPAKKTKEQAQGGEEWEESGALGWSMWVRPNAPGRLMIASEGARTGKHALLIEGCDSGSGIQNLVVKPGERYQVSCWARTNITDDERTQPAGSLKVSWKTPDGQWHARPLDVSVELPVGTTEWRKLSAMVNVPSGTGRMVVLLGAQSQGPEGRTWFDDVSIIQLYGGDGT